MAERWATFDCYGTLVDWNGGIGRELGQLFGDERRDWSFLPSPDRDGLQIGALDDGQRRLAHELIVAGTSLPGYAKVVSVMAMEHVLRALAPGLADLFGAGPAGSSQDRSGGVPTSRTRSPGLGTAAAGAG